jgi:hypothetical protein
MILLSILSLFLWRIEVNPTPQDSPRPSPTPTAATEPQPLPAATPVPKVTLLPQTGVIDLNGPDFVATRATPFDIPQTFARDPKTNEMNLITAWKSHVEGLGNVAIVFFRATSDTMSDPTLNSQIADLWHHYSKVVATSALDVFILRGVNSEQTKMCSYIYVKGSNGAWHKNRDASFVDQVIKAGI